MQFTLTTYKFYCVPTLNTLTMTSGYSNVCCVNVSNLCIPFFTNDTSLFNSIAVINLSLWSVSNTPGSLGMDNSSFKSAFTHVNSSIINVNASISTLFQLHSSAAWALTQLPAALSKLSTSYWIDHARLTQNINKLTSVLMVA